jgi:hypothetical protein
VTTFRRAASAVVAALLALGFGLTGAATSAAASDGSIPVQVSQFLSEGLTARLSDLYGPGTGGTGIAFNSTTAYGSTSRVFEFAPGYVSKARRFSTADPAILARRVDEWVTVVSVDKTPIGVATVSYSTAGGAVLTTFTPDLTLAAALPKLAATAQLVHDGAHHAWGSLAGDTITPIEAGSTGLTAATSLASYPRAPTTTTAAKQPAGVDPGVAAGAISLILVVVIIALVLLWPRRKRTL